MQVAKSVDASGLNCPLPILRTKKSLAELASGQILHLVTTDPGSTRDIAAFCRQTGHKLLSHTETPEKFEFYIQHR